MTVTRATTATTARFRTRIIAVPVSGEGPGTVSPGGVGVSSGLENVFVSTGCGVVGELVGSADGFVGWGVSVAAGVGVATGVADVPNPATPLEVPPPPPLTTPDRNR